MNYILKQFDEPLVKFSATTDTSEPEIQILWTNEEKGGISAAWSDAYAGWIEPLAAPPHDPEESCLCP